MQTIRRILVPTDFEAGSIRALDAAILFGEKFGAHVSLLHVVPSPQASFALYAEGLSWPLDELLDQAHRTLEGVLQQARMQYVRVEGTIVHGVEWETILDAVKERQIDLVVMGSHGRSGLIRVCMGSVAERVTRLSPVPVLLVPLEER